MPARLYIIEDARHFSHDRLDAAFPELARLLARGGQTLASLNLLTKTELIDPFGRESAEALLDELAARELGWLIRGVWGRDAAGPEVAAAASRLCAEFPMSKRLQTCLVNSEIHNLGELAVRTEDQLLAMKNLGRKCLAEVRDLLAEAGLRLGMHPEELAGGEKDLCNNDGCIAVNLFLLWRTERLDLADGLQRAIKARQIAYVGDLACLPPDDSVLSFHFLDSLSQSLGAWHAMIQQMKRQLRRLGIDIGDIPHWQVGRFQELERFFTETGAYCPLAKTVAPVTSGEFSRALAEANTIEQELRVMAAWATSDRDAQIAARYLGWDGRGGSTLEEVATETSLTRERVRQIQHRVLEKFRKPASDPVLLRRAIDLVTKRAPGQAEAIEGEIRAAGLSAADFRLEGLLSASVACGLPTPFSLVTVGDTRFVTLVGRRDVISATKEIAQNSIATRGVATVSEVAQQAGLSAHLVRSVLMHDTDIRWLGCGHEWFWSPKFRGNRLVSRIRQILSQVPEVSAELLHAGLLWKENLSAAQLPISIMLALCADQNWSEFTKESDQSKPLVVRARASQTAESRMVGMLKAFDGVLRAEDFMELCARDGITGGAVSVVLGMSSLIRIDDQVCRLVGTTHSPGLTPIAEPSPLHARQDHTSEAGFLNGCNPVDSDFVPAAAARIKDRASALGWTANGAARSLIELGWVRDDLGKLRDWGQRGTLDFRRLLGSGNEALGLVFLAYCMEITRTEAHEGEMWPQIYASLGPVNRELLFVARGIARPRVLDAMERAGRNLNLRHVFGREGAQARLRSVYLQFGITDAGWRRLPWWLSGQGLSITAADLLTKESNLYSASFAELWHTLQEFRWGTLSREEALGPISNNPWVSSAGPDNALDLAASHRDVQRADEAVVPENESLLAPPRLSTSGDEPCFEITLSRKPPSWMTAPRYVLVLGKQARWQVSRNAGGEYVIEAERAVLPPVEPVLPVDLLLNGRSVLPEPLSLELYGEHEEIVAFHLSTGRKLDIWEAMEPSRPCALLCAHDIVLDPSSPEWRMLFGGDRVLWLYRRGLPAELTATLAGELLWTPVEQPTPKAANQFEPVVRCRGGSWGDAVRVHADLEPGIEPRKLHIGNQTLRAHVAADGAVQFDSLRLGPEIDVQTSAVLEFVSKGQLKRIPIRFETVPGIGAAVETAGKWKVLDGGVVLDRGDLTGRRLFVRPPPAWGSEVTPIEDWALVEGSNFCARPKSVDRDFQDCLFGLGQPLELGIGPYNRSGEDRIRLAKSVTDSGLIVSARREGERWRIVFRQAIEPGPSHAIWVWTNASVVCISGEWAETTWETEAAAMTGEPIAFALAFNGACVGTALGDPSPYLQLCDQIRRDSDWLVTAAWLRWFRIPLLDDEVRHAIAERIRECWLDTFWTWLNPDGAPAGGLRQNDPRTERWQYAMRRFFERWRPTRVESGELLRRFALLTGEPQHDIEQAWERYDELLDIHPALSANAAVNGIMDIYAAFRPSERRILLEMLENLLLDLAPAAGEAERGRSFAKLLDQSAQSLNVDTAFIERSLLPDAVRLSAGTLETARNLRIALAVRPFRRWLAAKLIQHGISNQL